MSVVKLFQVCDWTRKAPALVACSPVVDELLNEGENKDDEVCYFFFVQFRIF